MNSPAPPSPPIPSTWDRGGLPAWTCHSPAMFGLENRYLFLNHWQFSRYVNDIPAPGDWRSFDLLGERAAILHGQDGVVRAFRNLCRHRGARVVDGVFSTKWYLSLFASRQVGDAVILSVKIALISASVATILGTMAGIGLARVTRFRGRILFSGLVNAPLIIPEVITGISSLMFLILLAEYVGWPIRPTDEQ